MIKFGEKFALLLAAGLTAGFYIFLFLFQSNWWLLVPIQISLAAIIYFVVSHAAVRHYFWWLYSFTQVGLLLLYTVVEWPSSLVVVTALGILSAVVILLWSRRVSAPIVFVREKPLRRAVSAALTLAVFGFCAFIQARAVFFPSTTSTLLSPIFQALIIAAASFLLWSLYFQAKVRDYLIPLAVVGILAAQAALLIGFSSVGYLVGALMLSWLWYILQLLIRFHFGNRDILWFKQRQFLVINAVLFAIFLSIIRYL